LSSSDSKPVAAILGYGRFGALWAKLNSTTFKIIIFDSSAERQKEARADGFETIELKDCLKADIVFFAVPMSIFESVLLDLLKYKTSERLQYFQTFFRLRSTQKRSLINIFHQIRSYYSSIPYLVQMQSEFSRVASMDFH